jgi:hypothetical protein
MIFPVITLLTALALAAVAGWFSIAGLVTILAGQPIAALTLGMTLEAGKLVTASWLYRNWQLASWRLKLPLMYFMLALMTTTSMGVFGYLSKAHLEQGAATIDNTAKIEELDRRISNEQRRIDDSRQIILQLDSAVDAYMSKGQTSRALSTRRAQQAQRDQVSTDIQEVQAGIDQLNTERFRLSSELRKLELEVGPIKYIANVIYDTDDATTLEAAVRIFILIVVSTLDPLAITLLIAANFTLLHIRKQAIYTVGSNTPNTPVAVTEPDEQRGQPTITQEENSVPVSDFDATVIAPGNDTTDVHHAVSAETLEQSVMTPPAEVEEAPCMPITDSSIDADADVAVVASQLDDSNAGNNVPTLADIIEYHDDVISEDTPAITPAEPTIEELRALMEEICKPTRAAGVLTPVLTSVSSPTEDAQLNSAATPVDSAIMQDTLRELKGRHVVLTPLVEPAQASSTEPTSAAPQTSVRSWIESFKDPK